MKTIISGSNHFIIPKKIVFTAFMVGLGAFFGMYLSEHLHAKRTETFLKKKNDSVKDANEKLVKEKYAYQSIFGSSIIMGLVALDPAPASLAAMDWSCPTTAWLPSAEGSAQPMVGGRPR